MLHPRKRLALKLSLVIVLLAFCASLGGVFIEGLYRDNEFVTRVWTGNDIITLFLAVPLMAVSSVLAAKGFRKAEFLWIGSLWYMIYNYIFYMYGAALSSVFLIHVLIFILSAAAFILALSSLDTARLTLQVGNSSIPFRRISSYMIFFGLFIGTLWTAMALSFVLSGVVPEGIAQTGHSTAVVFATDLSFLVTTLLVGAFLLWRKNVWGFIISTVIMVKGVLYPLVLLVGGILAYRATGIRDTLTPAYVLLGLGCLACLLSLLKAVKEESKL